MTTSIDQLEKNWQHLNARVSRAMSRASRTDRPPKIVAVTKYVDADTVRDLVSIGCTSIGESRPQELVRKAAALREINIEWHLVGHLQRNKVKSILPIARLIHSVESTRLVETISDQAQRESSVGDVLLEVNVSGDITKHGLPPDDLPSILEFASGQPGVAVRGLMAMSGLESNRDQITREFSTLRELRDRYCDAFKCENIHLDQLSMGMSADFEIAIEQGATIIRVGSLLFEDPSRE